LAADQQQMIAYFVSDDAETLVCERICFDTSAMIKQLPGGMTTKPGNWLPAARACGLTCANTLLAGVRMPRLAVIRWDRGDGDADPEPSCAMRPDRNGGAGYLCPERRRRSITTGLANRKVD
jgi:hypothetical protein